MPRSDRLGDGRMIDYRLPLHNIRLWRLHHHNTTTPPQPTALSARSRSRSTVHIMILMMYESSDTQSMMPPHAHRCVADSTCNAVPCSHCLRCSRCRARNPTRLDALGPSSRLFPMIHPFDFVSSTDTRCRYFGAAEAFRDR